MSLARSTSRREYVAGCLQSVEYCTSFRIPISFHLLMVRGLTPARLAASTRVTRVSFVFSSMTSGYATVQGLTEEATSCLLKTSAREWPGNEEDTVNEPFELVVITDEESGQAVKDALNNPDVVDALHAEALEMYETEGKALDGAIDRAEKKILPKLPERSPVSKYLHNRRLTGPLDATQIQTLELAAQGLNQMEIARRMGTSNVTVSQNLAVARLRLGLDSTNQLVAQYARAKAYRESAAIIRTFRVKDPQGDVEEHANHVLDGIARELELMAERLIP